MRTVQRTRRGKRVEVNKGDRYGDFEVIEEIEPLTMPSGENKRQILVKCHLCGNENYKILLAHLRREDIHTCDMCEFKYKKKERVRKSNVQKTKYGKIFILLFITIFLSTLFALIISNIFNF